ncbi:MAG: hypothetical protein Q4D51_03145 [Eubacteriales bacterium]|nr:hypothetical protein [Eubacteriales bacterium]
MKKDWINKNRKWIALLISVAVFVLFWIVFVIGSINRYHDTHTWASIQITGVLETDTSDAFEQSDEYLKGDAITVGDALLRIDDIKHNGTVTFHVERGKLTDENGEEVKTGTITYQKKERYYLEHGTVQLQVISNRYE